MSQKKEKNSLPTGSRKTSVPIPQEQPSAPEKAQERKKKETIHKRSIFLFWFTLAALLVIFGGRWLVAITNDYFDSFVHRGSSVTEAVNNMEGLTLTEGEQAELLPLQQQWDLFTSSRLRDEVTMTASDGTELHAYLYNEQSDTTVVVIPRFDEDGTADFLPGPWLNAQTGCNILLLDQRLHGKSGGSSFGFGYLEQQDSAEAKNFIMNDIEGTSANIWKVTKEIESTGIAAIIIGKMAEANRYGIQLDLQADSSCRELTEGIAFDCYVTVLGNLLQNAIDELRESTEKVKEISLGLFIDADYTILTVTDTGRGMSPDIRAHLFEKGVSTKGGEHGRGLFLVKELVEKYHGTIDVDTEIGEGTSITVSFQRLHAQEEDVCTE